MFFFKEKWVSCLVILISLFFCDIAKMYSQKKDISLVYHKKMYINGNTIYLPVYEINQKTVESTVSVIKEADTSTFKTNWDTKKFNPYKGQQVNFPFELRFEDTHFSSPVDRKIVVTSRYGWRRGRAHQGIDIDLQIGDTVKTILGGKVRYVGYHGGHGKTVVVRHHNGLETVYAHLSTFLVKENEDVEKGQAIAKGGITGNARGSHLHLEVKYHGKNVHPEYLFDFSDTTKVRSEHIFVTRKWATAHYHKSTRKSNIVVHKSIDDIAIIKEQQKKIYTVKKGDNLYRIAVRHGLPLTEICKINSIRRNSILKIGQQLIVSAMP